MQTARHGGGYMPNGSQRYERDEAQNVPTTTVGAEDMSGSLTPPQQARRHGGGYVQASTPSPHRRARHGGGYIQPNSATPESTISTPTLSQQSGQRGYVLAPSSSPPLLDGGFMYGRPDGFDQGAPIAPSPPREMTEHPRYGWNDAAVRKPISNGLPPQPPPPNGNYAQPRSEYVRQNEPMLEAQAAEQDNHSNGQVVHLRGYRNIRHPQNAWRFEEPHAHLLPELEYDRTDKCRHHDVLGREWTGVPDDRYLSPWDGRPKQLIVQTTDTLYDMPGNTTYRRTFIRNISPFMIRLADWAIGDKDIADLTRDEWPMVVLRWIPASFALIAMLAMASNVNGEERNYGNYDVFPYKHYGYAKAPRNALESCSSALEPGKAFGSPRQMSERPTFRESFDCSSSTLEGSNTLDQTNPVIERALRPRYICFVEDKGFSLVNVSEWEQEHKDESLDYVFVAYSTTQFVQDDVKDMEALHAIAQRATKDAGFRAYWIGCSCMPDEHEMEKDVYRINDVVRGARSVVIAIGYNNSGGSSDDAELLRQWGARMWTYPEVLLSPNNDIKVFFRIGKRVRTIAKKQFAGEVWTDASASRQLLDHYEGNLILSSLELVTIALSCLYSRKTTEYLPGDHSYALMGLLRIRPKVEPKDTAFQAFARLSLANDNNMLLERLMCTLPKTPGQHWSDMSDAWDVNLWDIYPKCQVAGVGDNDTVIIDGLRGANVRWKSFARVRNLTRATLGRMFLQSILHGAPLLLLTGCAVVATQQSVGIPLIIFSLLIILSSPYGLRKLYGGKFWYTQPWLFGFEGYLPIETIERQIFGICLGRLEWSPYSSPLSRHRPNKHGECEAIDPTQDPEVRSLIAKAQNAKAGDQRIFTIVDTGTMQVTLIQAIRPPIAFLLAGEEGGMQRAIGVSYEWETATCYRETVMRMATPMYERMSPVPRVRFGLNRDPPKTRPFDARAARVWGDEGRRVLEHV